MQDISEPNRYSILMESGPPVPVRGGFRHRRQQLAMQEQQRYEHGQQVFNHLNDLRLSRSNDLATLYAKESEAYKARQEANLARIMGGDTEPLRQEAEFAARRYEIISQLVMSGVSDVNELDRATIMLSAQPPPMQQGGDEQAMAGENFQRPAYASPQDMPATPQMAQDFAGPTMQEAAGKPRPGVQSSGDFAGPTMAEMGAEAPQQMHPMQALSQTWDSLSAYPSQIAPDGKSLVVSVATEKEAEEARRQVKGLEGMIGEGFSAPITVVSRDEDKQQEREDKQKTAHLSRLEGEHKNYLAQQKEITGIQSRIAGMELLKREDADDATIRNVMAANQDDAEVASPLMAALGKTQTDRITLIDQAQQVLRDRANEKAITMNELKPFSDQYLEELANSDLSEERQMGRYLAKELKKRGFKNPASAPDDVIAKLIDEWKKQRAKK